MFVIQQMSVRITIEQFSLDFDAEQDSPSPSPDSASEEHSLFPHRGGWPEACSLQSTGSQEPLDPLEPYSTHDAPSSPGHTTPSTARRVIGQTR